MHICQADNCLYKPSFMHVCAARRRQSLSRSLLGCLWARCSGLLIPCVSFPTTSVSTLLSCSSCWIAGISRPLCCLVCIVSCCQNIICKLCNRHDSRCLPCQKQSSTYNLLGHSVQMHHPAAAFNLPPCNQSCLCRKMVESAFGRVDFAMAEALAFGALALHRHAGPADVLGKDQPAASLDDPQAGLNEGAYAIRLTGQDSERGTFNQRHAVLHDQHTGAR